MKELERSVISIKYPVRSLLWSGDTLVDLVGGIRVFNFKGEVGHASISWAYKFDSAIFSNDGNYAAVYELLGTKCILLKGRQILREINRSFYHAHDYEYPIAFIALKDGTQALAHCPEYFNKIEIEEVESGRRLTGRDTPPANSMFHSRLAASEDGKYLISAGWVWHPMSQLWIYDLEEVMRDPRVLDSAPRDLYDKWNLPGYEVDSAAFSSNERLLFTTFDDWEDEDDADDLDDLGLSDSGIAEVAEQAAVAMSLSPRIRCGRKEIVEFELDSRTVLSSVPLDQPTGTLMPSGDYVVAFDKHPRLLNMRDGVCVEQWPNLATGNRAFSIRRTVPPCIALDPKNHRFAVASNDAITVIQLG